MLRHCVFSVDMTVFKVHLTAPLPLVWRLKEIPSAFARVGNQKLLLASRHLLNESENQTVLLPQYVQLLDQD